MPRWLYLANPRSYMSLTAIASLLWGCSGMQSALDPAGPQAALISHLWWLMFAVCAAVFLLVIGFLLYAVFHRRRSASDAADPAEPYDGRRMTMAVGGAVAATVGILFVLLVVSVSAGRGLSSLSSPDALRIEVIGHQWWWEVHYVDPVPSQRVVTANEIHIPVGRPVVLKLTSRDVIHSFWVPNLHGKRDLIPGHDTTIWLQADKSGVFRGQCAEFCGHQHALMAVLIVAEPPEQFAAWLEQQRQPAAQPADDRQRRGQEVFLASPCIMCHTIQGTPAGGRVAPDLTHLASRRTIAAGTSPNTPGHLAGWIIDPQNIKPGNKMPPTGLASDDLQALLAYLQSLK
jgi:cytochrome c oxidase subunit 2